MDALVIENVLESLPVGLMVISPDGRIEVANRALTSILGLDGQSVVGQGWGQLFFMDEGKNLEFNQVFIDVVHNETVNLARSVPYTTAAGDQKHLTIISSFLRADHEMVAVVVLVKDDTEVHRLHEREKAAILKNSQLQQQRFEGLKKMSQSVAHQIRNPVMTIGGFANLMLRGAGGDKDNERHLRAMLEETRKLEGVVAGVSEFASIPPASPSDIHSEALAEDLYKKAEVMAAKKGKTLDWRPKVQPGMIRADYCLLLSALEELVENAVDFTPGGEVCVDFMVRFLESAVLIEVRDRGQGLPQGQEEYLFDPFFTTRPVGVGMGLALVRRIVAEHGGTVRMRPSSTRGAVAVMTLPANPDVEDKRPDNNE